MNTWRPCSSCKKPILAGKAYYACSVSTCNRTRVPYVFCTVACWDAHVPAMNHRDAWCVEQFAPLGETAQVAAAVGEPRRRIVPTAAPTPAPGPDEVLIVASRLKQYITDRADMNTSADVLEALSDIVRAHTDRAIDVARADGRKTVKGRDFR
ncbi:MAG: hypothetical protein Q8P41_17105 [Pseudomonadota bacterium]|nr:hypothetical protein [Pseudomonadota bacterium]